MKISIIMPAYNAQAYLEYSLGSIVSQQLDVTETEVIVINDGSKDGSAAILDKFAKQYPYIKVVHQENQGEAASRNRAIAMAQGEYIAFVDADDAIYENTLEKAIDYVIANDLEILYLNIHLFTEESKFISETEHMANVGDFRPGIQFPRRPFPATIYKRSLIGKVLYPSGILIGPDSVFNFKVQFFSKKVGYLNIPYYKYTQRPTSLSKQGRSEKAFEGFMNGIKEINKFEKEVVIDDIDKQKYFENMYHVFITRILELNILPTFNQDKYKQLKSLLVQIDKQKLMQLQDEKYAFFSTSFMKFKFHQKYIILKSKLYRLIYRK